MRKKLVLALVVVVIIVGVTLGAVSYTSSDGFCGKCHPILLEEFRTTLHHAPKKKDHDRAGCIDCHAEPGLFSMMHVKVKGLRDLEETAMLSPDDPMTPQRAEVRDVVCAQCHEDIVTSMHASAMDNETGDIIEGILPPGTRLARIGMNMNGTLHLDAEFKARCAECHDRLINFLKEDPMSCASCHWNVAHNPTSTNRYTGRRGYTLRYDRNIPAMVQVCGRCHNGGTHGNGQWPSPEARKVFEEGGFERKVMANVFMYEKVHGALVRFERENPTLSPEDLAKLVCRREPHLVEEVKSHCSGCHANLWDWETAKRQKRKQFRIERFFMPVGQRGE